MKEVLKLQEAFKMSLKWEKKENHSFSSINLWAERRESFH